LPTLGGDEGGVGRRLNIWLSADTLLSNEVSLLIRHMIAAPLLASLADSCCEAPRFDSETGSFPVPGFPFLALPGHLTM